jgi:hypothetical protein
VAGVRGSIMELPVLSREFRFFPLPVAGLRKMSHGEPAGFAGGDKDAFPTQRICAVGQIGYFVVSASLAHESRRGTVRLNTG